MSEVDSDEFAVFTELDHRLSVVKRWGILQTLQTQSVAEHCFNVERIAVRIAVAWFGIRDQDTLYQIRAWAHHHDDLEAVSGDLPTMIKPYLGEDRMKSDHADLIPVYDFPEKVKKIVKLADLLEGYHFLSMEVKLGNQFVSNHTTIFRGQVLEFVQAIWPKEKRLVAKVNEAMDGMDRYFSARISRRGR